MSLELLQENIKLKAEIERWRSTDFKLTCELTRLECENRQLMSLLENPLNYCYKHIHPHQETERKCINMDTIQTRNLEKVQLISADLVFEKPNSELPEKFGLRLVYDLFYKNGQIDRLTIPHIDMCIPDNRLPEMEYITNRFSVCHISSQLSGLRLVQDDSGVIWKTEVIKPAVPVEMSVSEIEKALGHPVKIVNDSKDDSINDCFKTVYFSDYCYRCKHLHCQVNQQPCKKCREIKHTTSGEPAKWKEKVW